MDNVPEAPAAAETTSTRNIGGKLGRFLKGAITGAILVGTPAAVLAPSNELAIILTIAGAALGGGAAVATSPTGETAPQQPSPKPERPVFKPSGRPLRVRLGSDRARWTTVKKDEIARKIK